jgi:hypothetical protein
MACPKAQRYLTELRVTAGRRKKEEGPTQTRAALGSGSPKWLVRPPRQPQPLTRLGLSYPKSSPNKSLTWTFLRFSVTLSSYRLRHHVQGSRTLN